MSSTSCVSPTSNTLPRRPSPHRLVSEPRTTLFDAASSFQTLIEAQACISSTHSASSELLSIAESRFPPSTLPISTLTNIVHASSTSGSATPSTASSSKSSFSSASSLSTSTSAMGGAAAATAPGLDLLGILAEEVDWDPQQRGSPGSAQLALVGHTLQSHHEAKQKSWATHILGSLGLVEPDSARKRSFSSLTAPFSPELREASVKAHIPALLAEPDAKPARPCAAAKPTSADPLNTMVLTKRTALFYEKLYDRLCPGIVPRAYIYPKLGRRSHDQDPTFAGLALSISLLGMLGLTLPRPAATEDGQRPFAMPAIPRDKHSKSKGKRETVEEAARIIEAVLALRLSAPGGGAGFGQSPTLETVLTSFFLSVALYSLDDAADDDEWPSLCAWRDASFFRFCEAITLVKILGFDQLAQSDPGEQTSDEASVVLLLARAERWWAEQRPEYLCQLEVGPRAAPARKRSRSEALEEAAPVKRNKQETLAGPLAEPLSLLIPLGFAGVRKALLQKFALSMDCWTGRCRRGRECRLASHVAVRIHDALGTLENVRRRQDSDDPILVDLARQALRAQLWIACLNHGLVDPRAEAPLRPDQPLHVALDTLDLLEDLHHLLRLQRSTSAVADAVREALHTIRECVALLPTGKFATHPFAFEQIQAGDEGDSPQPDSPSSDDGQHASNSTTITRAAQSVMDNLDRFLQRQVT